VAYGPYYLIIGNYRPKCVQPIMKLTDYVRMNEYVDPMFSFPMHMLLSIGLANIFEITHLLT